MIALNSRCFICLHPEAQTPPGGLRTFFWGFDRLLTLSVLSLFSSREGGIVGKNCSVVELVLLFSGVKLTYISSLIYQGPLVTEVIYFKQVYDGPYSLHLDLDHSLATADLHLSRKLYYFS